MFCGLIPSVTVAVPSYYIVIDVPATLGGVQVHPGDVVLRESGGYSLIGALPGGMQPLSLHVRDDGICVFTLSEPVALGGTSFESRDILAFDGDDLSILLDGGAAGIPDGARIDALFITSQDGLVMSFDIPVTLPGLDAGRSDLVLFAGVFSTYWDGDASGVPLSTNLVGADESAAGALVLAFDVPTLVGGQQFLPGDLVKWNLNGFTSFAAGSGWPVVAQMRDFSFVPSQGSGVVPGGVDAPGQALEISLLPDGRLTLTWGASCFSGDEDYEIYEGAIGDFSHHVPRVCTTGGALMATLIPSSLNSYYLVVPRNADTEGSYGLRSDKTERPRGTPSCRAQLLAVCK